MQYGVRSSLLQILLPFFAATSHSQISPPVVSVSRGCAEPQLTIDVPSGEYASELTQPACPFRRVFTSPDVASTMITWPGLLHEPQATASDLPSGENAIPRIVSCNPK